LTRASRRRENPHASRAARKGSARGLIVANRSPGWLTATALRFEPRPRNRFALQGWLVVSSAVENFINNDLLRASALTYTTALSIVPVLALAFSVLRGFGSADTLRPLIDRYLALGSSKLSDQLLGYVQNVNAAALGSAGGAFLLITVISTMGNVEQAFNTIFRVPTSRTYLRKFSDYLSVLFTMPLLAAATLAMTAMVTVKVSYASTLTQFTPYLIAWAGFFFLYVFFPYTKVRYGPAAMGSFVTAVLFQLAQWGYVRFQIGVANYQAIYGAFATLPIFLVWIYLAWSIVLFGAELTAALQRDLEFEPLKPLSMDFPYAAALHILMKLADRQANGGEPVTQITLGRELRVSHAALEPIVGSLEDAGLVVESRAEAGGPGIGLFLVRDPAAITLDDALGAMLRTDADVGGDPRVKRVLERIAATRAGVLKSITIADLLRQPADAPAA
jgi:membrane protein